MKVYIILCKGFAQTANRTSGFDKVRISIPHTDSPNVEIITLEWDDDFIALAARIAGALRGAPAAFVVAGYSFGGFLANKFCEEMQKYTMIDGCAYQIDNLILADPVARFWVRLPRRARKFLEPALRYAMIWWSLYPKLKIRVPSNVEELDVFRQLGTIPKGHFVEHSPETKLLINQILDVHHTDIDDSRAVREAIVLRASRVIRMWKGTDGV